MGTAFFGVYLQVLVFKAGTEQLTKATEAMVKVEVMTAELRDTTHGQNERMLDHIIGERSAIVDRLRAIEERATSKPGDVADPEQFKEIREAIEKLRDSLSSSSTPQPEVAISASEYLQEARSRYIERPRLIKLEASQTRLLNRGTAILTAEVRNPAGRPVRSGTPIDFSCSIGAVSPSSALTTADGQAFVFYTAPAEGDGIAMVRAKVDSLETEVQIEFGGGGLVPPPPPSFT